MEGSSFPLVAGKGATGGGRDGHPDMPVPSGCWLLLLCLAAAGKQVRLGAGGGGRWVSHPSRGVGLLVPLLGTIGEVGARRILRDWAEQLRLPSPPALVVRVLVLFLSQQLTSFSRFCKIKVVQTQSCKGSQGIYRENSLLLPRAGCEKPENICNEVVEGYNLHVE